MITRIWSVNHLPAKLETGNVLSDKVERLAALILFVLAGIATGIGVTLIVGAFSTNPGCGLDCATPDATAALLSGLGTVLAFPILGYLFTRGARLRTRRTFAVLATLIVAAIIAAGGRYLVELHAHYQEAEAARPVTPDVDFMYMAIATRDIQTYTKAEDGASKPASVVPQWQRCVIAGARCDKKPRQARMLCKGGVVYIDEADWKDFSLIPRENLEGAVAMKSMDLCAPGNVP